MIVYLHGFTVGFNAFEAYKVCVWASIGTRLIWQRGLVHRVHCYHSSLLCLFIILKKMILNHRSLSHLSGMSNMTRIT